MLWTLNNGHSAIAEMVKRGMIIDYDILNLHPRCFLRWESTPKCKSVTSGLSQRETLYFCFNCICISTEGSLAYGSLHCNEPAVSQHEGGLGNIYIPLRTDFIIIWKHFKTPLNHHLKTVFTHFLWNSPNTITHICKTFANIQISLNWIYPICTLKFRVKVFLKMIAKIAFKSP